MLRLPAAGGRAIGFSPDALGADDWRSEPGVPPLRAALGYDLDERIVWAVDRRDRLVGIDLASGGWRAYAAGVLRTGIGADGSVYLVDSAGRLVRLTRRAPTILPGTYRRPPRGLWGAIGGQALVVGGDSALEVRLVSSDRAGQAALVSEGPLAATSWGELLAHADGDDLRLVRTSDGSLQRAIDLPGPPTALAFSPSGHRVYALVGREIVVVDRFTGGGAGSISLPGPGRELRVDPSGRWMLVRPPNADSAWVLDLATGRVAGGVATIWRDDLPLLAGARSLLVGNGEDVRAFNLEAAPPALVTHIPGGARDLWLAIPWVPPRRAPVAIAAAESASAVQDSALIGDLPDSAARAVEELWLQVSSSQNPEWAQDLAEQLRDGGHRAAVWDPTPPDESYRVVVGPFATRDTADAAGRRLGRPYFVVRRPPAPR